MKGTAFDIFHPIVPLVYFVVLLVLSMAALQPVPVAISLVGALSYALCLRGWRATVRSALWQMPLILVLALVNPLFSASGSTELFRIGMRAIYLESLIYGLCMGALLVAVLLSFSNAARVLSSDKIMALTGGVAPVIGLMISMIARLAPQFVRRGGDIGGVQQACTAARVEKGEGLRGRAGGNLRMVSVLMGWSMEDSLDTAAAMKARGWGAQKRRSVYARYRFGRADAGLLALVVLLGFAATVALIAASTTFRFYPTLSGFAPWWSWVPYVLFVGFPLGLEAWERVRWRS